MSTKQELAILLEEHDGEFLSGNAIAESLGITRAAIWKNIHQLEEMGYRIEAVNNRGYRLREDNDVLSACGIRKELGDLHEVISLEVLQEVTSTNNLLKEGANTFPAWQTIVADRQIAGKGRRTRSFYSPSGTGIYLSMLIRLPLEAEISTRITTAAAIAACRAIEETTDAKPEIKWVNDVFVEGRKICGILTEASISMESGHLDWAVMGIGLNVYEPEGGFPEEIRSIAGPIVKTRQKNLRNRMAGAFIRHFYHLCQNLTDPSLAEEYKRRSFLIGREINVIRGDQALPAVAEDIDEECRLLVRYPDGRLEALSSGEVSIRI